MVLSNFKINDKRDDFGFDIVTFLLFPLMVFTFLSLFGLQECRVIWLTSMLVTKLIAKLLQQG